MDALWVVFALCRAVSAGAAAVLFGASAMLALGGSPRRGVAAETALRPALLRIGAAGLVATLCLLPLQAARQARGRGGGGGGGARGRGGAPGHHGSICVADSPLGGARFVLRWAAA
ncbi:hypothetical protein PVA98_30670, partial [Achromobacter xylosoxidans]|nr:hypothetical protein [Achromobacter xylosoxidans]